MLRTTVGPLGGAVAAAPPAALLLSGFILGRYADDAMPAYYVLRPLLAAQVLSLLLGLVAWFTLRAAAPLVALLGAAVIAFWTSVAPWGHLLLLGTALSLLIALLVRLAGRTQITIPVALSRIALAFATAFFAIGLARAGGAMLASTSADPVLSADGSSGPNIYLLLLDGYPRADSLLSDMGIVNEPFTADLASRGFTVYARATTNRTRTELTLLGLLEGTQVGIPRDSANPDDRKAIRSRLAHATLPTIAQRGGYEWVVVDSPVGHVTFDGGRHIQHGALNTFEERLLGESLLAPAVAAWFPSLPMDSLRGHLNSSLNSLLELAGESDQQLVLVHLLAPHPPFLWNSALEPAAAPSYWPEVQLFESVSDITGLSLAEYAAGMRSQLDALNARLLETVDEMVLRDPDAVIVLFSDHGARRAFADQEREWQRIFLAARTPGFPDLFADDPSPTTILRKLLDTYLVDAPKPL